MSTYYFSFIPILCPMFGRNYYVYDCYSYLSVVWLGFFNAEGAFNKDVETVIYPYLF